MGNEMALQRERRRSFDNDVRQRLLQRHLGLGQLGERKAVAEYGQSGGCLLELLLRGSVLLRPLQVIAALRQARARRGECPVPLDAGRVGYPSEAANM